MNAAYRVINADPKLLEWARYSIRYNESREQQAIDFIGKVRWNKHPAADRLTVSGVRRALPQIERDCANE